MKQIDILSLGLCAFNKNPNTFDFLNRLPVLFVNHCSKLQFEMCFTYILVKNILKVNDAINVARTKPHRMRNKWLVLYAARFYARSCTVSVFEGEVRPATLYVDLFPKRNCNGPATGQTRIIITQKKGLCFSRTSNRVVIVVSLLIVCRNYEKLNVV